MRGASSGAAGARWGFPLALLGGAVALFVGLSAYLRAVERAVVPAGGIAAQFDAGGGLRPVAAVRRAVRAMKLVTVEIDTVVTATAAHESWRGDVSATVHAPARLYYGTDLSGLSDSAVSFSPVVGEFVVRVPRPGRLATEVYTEDASPEVQVGWMRMRSRAGEYYVGQARRALADRARELVLSPVEAGQVEAATKEQIAALVRAIAGERAQVAVVFEDGAGDLARGRAQSGSAAAAGGSATAPERGSAAAPAEGEK